MTEMLHLRRLRVRYRVGDDGPSVRRRLDAVLDRVLEEQLESALARSGVPLDEEICVRMTQGRKALLEDGREEHGPYQSPMEDGMVHFHEFVRREIGQHV